MMTSDALLCVQVEKSYDGPHLEDGKVTEQFMEDLMKHFKASPNSLLVASDKCQMSCALD